MSDKEPLLGTKIGELLINDLEGHVVMQCNFLDLHFICQLDVLADWIESLQNLYDDIAEQCKEPQDDS